MVEYYNSLSEKDRRRYAGAEALKLPHSGIRYISELFGCHRQTVSRGIMELENPEIFEKERSRKEGGGRKFKRKLHPGDP